jgi:hypothetical protein
MGFVSRRVITVVALVLAVSLLVPVAAMASGMTYDKNLISGFLNFNDYNKPDVSGDNVVFLTKSVLSPTAKWEVDRYNLRSGVVSQIAVDATFDCDEPAIDGSWVVWQVGLDIHAKNLSTGATKAVTNDALSTLDLAPAISGTYVVWSSYNGTDWDVWGRNISGTHAKFLVAGGTGDQSEPSIYGKRVAYRDASAILPSAGQIKVKTIGSSAGPKLITSNLIDQDSPSIGNHLVAWRATGIGHKVIKYYNYDTDTTAVVASGSVDMFNPQVSGDRVLYDFANGANLKDTEIFDARVNRTSTTLQLPFSVDNTTGDEIWGKVDGNKFVYLSGGYPSLGKMMTPSLSVGSVPKRIVHKGKLHLTGKLSDQGIPMAGSTVRLEKYSSGTWNLVRTATTNSSGNYSVYSNANGSGKTKYRIGYDGAFALFGPIYNSHFSAVSSVKTAWPR